MNVKVLKAAEKRFLKKYPGGFNHPEMVELTKKHKKDVLEKFAKENFSKKRFEDVDFVVAEMARLVGRSTLISMFEKPKFRDMINGLTPKQRSVFAEAMYELLHGKAKVGFESLVSELEKAKLAKWSLATALQTYYRPHKEVFVKPTTTKLIIDKLEIDLQYKPKPTWEFYRDYRKVILEMKSKVSDTLSPSNAAFCGFLMMSLGE
jgi:hypothetical protein